MPDYDSTRARAQAGALLLDQVFPGWHRIIMLREFSCEDANACILGQLAARDARVKERLLKMMHPQLAEGSLDAHGAAVALFEDFPTPQQMRRHGFSGSLWVGVNGRKGQVDLLEAAWRQEVGLRKNPLG